MLDLVGAPRTFFDAEMRRATNDCKLWPYATSSGYGQIKIDGKVRSVHVLACEAEHGPMPQPGMHATHGPCHERLCFNGRHLSWQTLADNNRDKLRDGTHARGERCATAKLTEAAVLEIRSLYAAGHVSYTELGSRFGVTGSAVYMVVKRKSWSWI